MSDTQEVVRTMIVDLVGAVDNQDLPADRYLIEDEILDSLGIFALVTRLEERFSIAIEPEEVVIANFATIAAVSELVDAKVADL